MALQYASPVRKTIVNVAEADLFVMTSPLDGVIRAFGINSSGLVAATAPAVFDLLINGVSVFGGMLPQINVGADSFRVLLPDVVVAYGDTVTVALISVHYTGIGLPLSAAIIFDDKLAASRFVQDFYTGAFARAPSGGELTAGVDAVADPCSEFNAAGVLSAARALGETLFTSAEYTARSRTDSQYVDDLYYAYLGRLADAGGHDYWLSQVSPQGRAAVRAAFAYSVEFVSQRVARMCAAVAPAADAISIAGRLAPIDTPADGEALVWSESLARYVHTLITGGGASITVEEIDGTPSVADVIKIKVPNGQLTNNGGGVVTVTPLQGAPGDDGADGEGVPAGGTTGQVLKKLSSTDFDTDWQDETGGGGGYVDVEFIRGLEVQYDSTSSITVSPGACYIAGSVNAVVENASPLSLDMSGILTTSTWFHIYATRSGGVIAISSGAAAPILYGVNASYATGNTSSRYLGSVKTNGSSQLYNFRTHVRAANEYTLCWRELNQASPFRVLANGQATSSTVVDLSAMLPVIVFKRYRFTPHLTMAAGDVINVGIDPVGVPSAAWYASELPMRGDIRNGSAAPVGWAFPPQELSLVTRELYYITGFFSSGGGLYIDSLGFVARR